MDGRTEGIEGGEEGFSWRNPGNAQPCHHHHQHQHQQTEGTLSVFGYDHSVLALPTT